MTELFLIRGLPGSGKSTFAKKLQLALDEFDYSGDPSAACHHFENDMYHIKDGVYKFKPELVQMAAKWCRDKTKAALQLGCTVIVSNTFVQRWKLNPYLWMAEELKVGVTVITCNGNYGSIHDVPEETMARMRRQWEEVVI